MSVRSGSSSKNLLKGVRGASFYQKRLKAKVVFTEEP